MATPPQVCTEFTESEWAIVQNYNKASQYLEWISRYISCTDVVAPGHRKPGRACFQFVRMCIPVVYKIPMCG